MKQRTGGEKEGEERREACRGDRGEEGRRHRLSVLSPGQGLGAFFHPGPQPWGKTVEGIASLGHSVEGFQIQGFSGEFQNSLCQLRTQPLDRATGSPQAPLWVVGLPSSPLGPSHPQQEPWWGFPEVRFPYHPPRARRQLRTEKALGLGSGGTG